MRRISVKLVAGLLLCLALAFAGVGTANLRLLRRNLEDTAVLSARRMADIIFRSTRHGMMSNNRADIIEVIRSIGVQEGVRAIRVYDKAGRIQYSTHEEEIGAIVDTKAEACIACHSAAAPLAKPESKNTVRIYRAEGERRMGLIRPIENEAGCSAAACHAHPPDQRVLGVLDVVLSLERVDENLATQERRMLAQVAIGGLLIVLMVSLLVWQWVLRPLRELRGGIEQFGGGNLEFRFARTRQDEFGQVENAFNAMADDLDAANRTLEERIQRKTRQLESAQQQLIHSEKLASLGQLAASVAHELNNPLAGILTYAKLMEKKLKPEKPALDWLHTIQHESRRCGEIVNNLLVFARSQQTNPSEFVLKDVLDRTVAVVKHKFEMQGVALDYEPPDGIKLVADAGQLQQVLLAIVVNALEAIASDVNLRGGGAYVRIRAAQPQPDTVEVSIANNGPPIPEHVMPHLFEPFFSTKGAVSGVGLGLSVAYGVVRRHRGEIEVSTGAETTFLVRLPVNALPATAPEVAAAATTEVTQ